MHCTIINVYTLQHSRASRSSAEECKAKLASLPPTGGETFYNNVQNDGVAWTPSSAVAVYSEAIPVMQFLISRLEESNMCVAYKKYLSSLL